MKQESPQIPMVPVDPMTRTTELTPPKLGFWVWRVTTSQWMLSSTHSTALVRNTPVRGTLLKADVMWVPRTCSWETRMVCQFSQTGKWWSRMMSWVQEDAWYCMPKLLLCRTTSKDLFSVMESSLITTTACGHPPRWTRSGAHWIWSTFYVSRTSWHQVSVQTQWVSWCLREVRMDARIHDETVSHWSVHL